MLWNLNFPAPHFISKKTLAIHHACKPYLLNVINNQKKIPLYRSSHWRQESTCVRVSFLIKLQALTEHLRTPRCLRTPAALLKKRLCHKCYPVNFVKFLRTLFLQSTSRRLFLPYSCWIRRSIGRSLPPGHPEHRM